MKKTFKVMSLTLLLSLTSQIFPANLIIEKTQEPKTEKQERTTQAKPAQAKPDQKEILEKKETKKEKRAKLRKEKKAAKQAKKLKLKTEKEVAKKNKPKRSTGKKIAIAIGVVAATLASAFCISVGAAWYSTFGYYHFHRK